VTSLPHNPIKDFQPFLRRVLFQTISFSLHSCFSLRDPPHYARRKRDAGEQQVEEKAAGIFSNQWRGKCFYGRGPDFFQTLRRVCLRLCGVIVVEL